MHAATHPARLRRAPSPKDAAPPAADAPHDDQRADDEDIETPNAEDTHGDAGGGQRGTSNAASTNHEPRTDNPLDGGGEPEPTADDTALPDGNGSTNHEARTTNDLFDALDAEAEGEGEGEGDTEWASDAWPDGIRHRKGAVPRDGPLFRTDEPSGSAVAGPSIVASFARVRRRVARASLRCQTVTPMPAEGGRPKGPDALPPGPQEPEQGNIHKAARQERRRESPEIAGRRPRERPGTGSMPTPGRSRSRRAATCGSGSARRSPWSPGNAGRPTL